MGGVRNNNRADAPPTRDQRRADRAIARECKRFRRLALRRRRGGVPALVFALPHRLDPRSLADGTHVKSERQDMLRSLFSIIIAVGY